MRTVDVIFPQNIGRLTYSVPDKLQGSIAPGMLVGAELRKSIKKGIVLGTPIDTPKGKLKPIDSIIRPGLNPAMLKLISWMSEYYFTNEGLVLKGILPREFFEPVKKRATKPREQKTPEFLAQTQASYGLDMKTIAPVREAARGSAYAAFLHHAQNVRQEVDAALAATEDIRNVIEKSLPRE